jgi:membrane protein YqaA with SNARE-associated domain
MFAPVRRARVQSSGFSAFFRHLGALGLFSLAILDSSPVPTFAGPDILIAILSASHRNPWYEYAAVATAGSVIGAYITFHLAQRAGADYLKRKFGKRGAYIQYFEQWGTLALAVSTAVPFPFPTSVLFAAAGASGYSLRSFLIIVTLCRGIRYAALALLADLYGRHLLRVLRHPTQYWPWLFLIAAIVGAIVTVPVLLKKQLRPPLGVPEAADRA